MKTDRQRINQSNRIQCKCKWLHTSPRVHSIWPRKSSSDTCGVLLSMS